MDLLSRIQVGCRKKIEISHLDTARFSVFGPDCSAGLEIMESIGNEFSGGPIVGVLYKTIEDKT